MNSSGSKKVNAKKARIITLDVNSLKCLVQITKQMVCEYLQKEAHNIWAQCGLSK